MSSIAPQIATDLACTACGYDLRTLGSSSACPECGLAVATSMHDRLVTRPQWLAGIGAGSFLIGLGILTGAAGVALATMAGRVALWLLPAGRMSLWLLPIGVLIAGAGTWRFAAPTPRVAGSHGRWLSTLLRVAGVATCTLQLQLCATFLSVESGVMRVHPSTLLFCVRSLLPVWGAAAVMTCLRAAFVAALVRDRSGVVQARVLALLAPLVLLACISATGTIAAGQLSKAVLIGSAIGACVVASWSAIFFSAFALVVRRRAAIL